MAATAAVDTTKPEYLNWIKAGLVLRQLKAGIEGFLDNAMRRVHGDLLASTQRQLGITALTCTSCDSRKLRNPRYTCPQGICSCILQQVESAHMYSKANLNNTDVSVWLNSAKHWEIAKCFLANGYSTQQSAVDTDCAGLLSLMLNCLDLHSSIAANLTRTGNVVAEVRDLRNGVMHSASLTLATSDLDKLIKYSKVLLNDAKRLQHDPAAQAAARVVSEIEAGTLKVTLADQLTMVQEARLLSTDRHWLQTLDDAIVAIKQNQTALEAAQKTQGAILTSHESRLAAQDARLTTQESEFRRLEAWQGCLEERVDKLEHDGHDANTTDAAEAEFKECQKAKFARKLKTLVVSRWTRVITVDDIYTPIKIREDMEKELSERALLASGSHRKHIGTKNKENKHIEDYDEVFCTDGIMHNDICVLGKAGIGKSLFINKLVNVWVLVQNQEPSDKIERIMSDFQYVFIVYCKYAGRSDTLRDMIIKQNCDDIDRYKSVVRKLLQSPDKRCLILVDGLDEWSASASDTLNPCSQPGIPDREGLGRNCTVLTTSRPWRVEALEKGLGHECRVFEIVGLDKDGVLSLSKKLLKALNDPDSASSAKEFYETITKLKMKELVKIPLMLTYVVESWHRSGHKLDRSLCMNYSGMLESLMQRSDGPCGSKSDGNPQTNVEQRHTVPSCFANRNLCQQNWPLIQKLSHLAFHSLLGQEKERALVFRKHDLVNQLGETDLEECLKIGILSQSDAELESAERMVSVSFFHKTFQEFLAGLYMYYSSWDNCFEIFQARCETVINVLDLQLVITFLCGLGPSKGRELCLYVLKLVGGDEGIEEFRQAVGRVLNNTASHLYAPVSTVIGLENMLLDCAGEVYYDLQSKRDPKHTALDNDFAKQQITCMYIISDVYIHHSFRPDVCEMLYSHVTLNAQCIRSLVFTEIVTPVKVLEMLNKMDNLARLDVTCPFQHVTIYLEMLCRLLPKLQQMHSLGFKVGHNTSSVPLPLVKTLLDSVSSITSLYLRRMDIASDLPLVSPVECQFPVNLVSLRLEKVSMPSQLLPSFTSKSLRTVNLSQVTLSHTQIEILCDCLKSSPSLLELELFWLSCSDCDDQCRCCLDLSSAKQLHKLELRGFGVTRLTLDSSELEWVEIWQLSVVETWGPIFTSLTQSHRLRLLVLSGCSLSPGDVSTLVKNIIPSLPQLEGLWLEDMNFGDQETVTASNMLRAESICLRSVTMSASGWRQFIQSLPRHRIEVKLASCNVYQETVSEIGSSPRYRITDRGDTRLFFVTVPTTLSCHLDTVET